MSLLFWASTFLLIYTYLGYPIIIYFLSRLFHAENIKNIITPHINIVMVVYNGELYLEAKIHNILSSNYPRDRLHLIIISDGSTDGTVNILDKYAAQIQFHHFDVRRGKAACLNDALEHCNYDYVVFSDVRQRFAVNTISHLISRLSDSQVGAVSGELMIEDDGHNDFSKGIDAYWRYEKFIRNSEARYKSVVGVTGAVYAIKRSLYKSIPTGVILDDVLIPMQIIVSGYRVVFEPEALAYDYPSIDKKRERGRKIRTLAGNYQLISLMPVLLNPFKNPLFIQFISHKLLRLLGPLLLLLIFVSNLYLISDGWFYKLSIIIQTTVYILALVSTLSLKLSNNKFIRLVRVFIILNWYSFLGLVEYVKNNKTHLW